MYKLSHKHTHQFSSHLGSSLGKLARNSRDEVDLWVFVTARGNGNPLGIAYVGTVCSSGRSNRVSINRYGIAGKQKNKVLYTAEVVYFIIKVLLVSFFKSPSSYFYSIFGFYFLDNSP